MKPVFKPVKRVDGYLPIQDHGLIGNCSTAALVGIDGSLSWMCIPYFDSRPVFCGILDAKRGGGFRIAPEDLAESMQYYEPDSGVLITEMRSPSGLLKVTDALTLRSGVDLTEDAPAGRSELIRMAEALHGKIKLSVEIEPRGGADIERYGGGFKIKWHLQPEMDIYLFSPVLLQGLKTTIELKAGDRFYTVLRWEGGTHRYHFYSPEGILKETINAWHRWIKHFSYNGPQESLVRRSAITLKLLDYTPTGAMVAAPTSSLPEAIGGQRNWDYRYAWIRDAAFSVYALKRIGLNREASSFLGWVLDTIEREGYPRILYDLRGHQPPPEKEDPELEGYRKSLPVRWGNAAADQKQHDVYGEIVDCAYQWARWGGKLDETLWARLKVLVEKARTEWKKPDHGIWEVRTAGRPFTYSAAMCHVALNRGARLAEIFSFPGDITGWRAEAEKIKQAILEEAWDPDIGSITEHFGGGGLDASLLTLPLRRVLHASHPKMVATTNAIAKHLGTGNGLLYRYLPDKSPDGLPGHEGAFLLCSFWMVDNLAKQGQLERAMEIYHSLCSRANHLGLFSEEIDPVSGTFLGNFPQAFSHVGLISSGINLSRLMKGGKE
ncbi:MAG: glycoside hydrolase family 15 protein [Candidatus Loosdrechtia sp.]|uniref:glycoside hydrolase family 15 protein n=1 Tax=Candidatus Loosdrechtia sp. TaxID=3101272 RepID=UPI003A6C741C|nr:MAG: glycoside hydrolase family 15 protein [Candidatus Jettenia sp. AMX2]